MGGWTSREIRYFLWCIFLLVVFSPVIAALIVCALCMRENPREFLNVIKGGITGISFCCDNPSEDENWKCKNCGGDIE